MTRPASPRDAPSGHGRVRRRKAPALGGPRGAEVPTLPLGGPLLSLDPSSSACGYAVFDPAGNPTNFGVVRPMPRSAPPIGRIASIVDGVSRLLREHRPVAVLVEFSSGKVHRAIKGRNPSGLSVLGAAQGAVWQHCRDMGYPTATVAEGDWTGGASKSKRAGRVSLLVPEYSAYHASGHDKGFDAADSIGIGLWFFGKAREAELLSRAGRGSDH